MTKQTRAFIREIEKHNLDAYERSAALTLALASDCNGCCSVTYEHIANKSSMSKRKAVYTIKSLVDKGFIVKDNEKYHACAYKITVQVK